MTRLNQNPCVLQGLHFMRLLHNKSPLSFSRKSFYYEAASEETCFQEVTLHFKHVTVSFTVKHSNSFNRTNNNKHSTQLEPVLNLPVRVQTPESSASWAG